MCVFPRGIVRLLRTTVFPSALGGSAASRKQRWKFNDPRGPISLSDRKRKGETSGGNKTRRIKLTECEHTTAVWTNWGGNDEEKNKDLKEDGFIWRKRQRWRKIWLQHSIQDHWGKVYQSCEMWFIFLFKTEERFWTNSENFSFIQKLYFLYKYVGLFSSNAEKSVCAHKRNLTVQLNVFVTLKQK